MSNANISPLAFVDPTAQLGDNVTIHPFAYIDKNVVIGDNCEIKPYASVLSGTRMGKNNRVFQNAVLGAEPQDFKYKGDETILQIGDNNVRLCDIRWQCFGKPRFSRGSLVTDTDRLSFP